jgi:DUF4097 and DUF4098 domain-containing protein YvlB
LVAAVAVVLGTVTFVFLAVIEHQQVEQFAFAPADVDRIVADIDTGYVTVTAEDRDDIAVTVVERSANIVDPGREVAVANGALRLSGECAGIGICEVSFQVEVPRTSSVEVDAATTGNVTTRGLAGDVTATTLAGDVVLQAHAGAQVEATTGDGAVRMLATRPPQAVAVRTGSGNVLLRLPDVGYRLDVTTGTGNRRVRLAEDPDADREVVVVSTSGNVVAMTP